MKLNYGMKLHLPKSYFIGLDNEIVEGIIGRYWGDDTDANAYKVRIFADVKDSIGYCSFYSSDLKQLICDGIIKIAQ